MASSMAAAWATTAETTGAMTEEAVIGEAATVVMTEEVEEEVKEGKAKERDSIYLKFFKL